MGSERVSIVITDDATLTDVRKSWVGVEALRERLTSSGFMAFGVGGFFPTALADAAHNLPFLHAFAVLNDVLEQLAEEDHFDCNDRRLGMLLKKSEKALSWQDYKQIKVGVKLRNDLAHRGLLLERGDCWTYIDAIKRQLSAWGIV